ncbi:MAG: indolepyruvate oxidoreductase subunit beta [Rhodospirillales bacterium]|nr:indolepyruvate oxidoreductase subunit beta [Rhodospirillales bacterium]
MSNITNILVVGVGGQGVMTASEILAQAAISLDMDVKKTEVAGMAQRGGVVTSHVRFGPKVLSPTINPGEADILLGFEPAEAMRWCTYLRPGGIAMVNTLRQKPPVVNIGLFDYPDDPVQEVVNAGVNIRHFDAGAMAKDLGNLRLVNTIMLGAIAEYLPYPAETMKQIIIERFRVKKPELAELNEKAFEEGRQAGSGEAAA